MTALVRLYGKLAAVLLRRELEKRGIAATRAVPQMIFRSGGPLRQIGIEWNGKLQGLPRTIRALCDEVPAGAEFYRLMQPVAMSSHVATSQNVCVRIVRAYYSIRDDATRSRIDILISEST